jgi:chromosomal replication initiator protein
VYFPTWIKPLSIESLEKIADDKQLVTILCPSSYHQTMVSQRYQGQIQRSLERISGLKTEVNYVIGKDPTNTTKQAPTPLFDPPSPPGGFGGAEGHHNLNPRLTFETYVVGGSNNFAYAAAQGAAKTPGTRHNPLFIYGGVGLGKTHLMQAIGHAIYKDHPDWNIMYISAETFGSDLIASLHNKKTPAFKKIPRTQCAPNR